MLLQRHDVRQFLARMGDGLHVDHRHRGVAREGLQGPVLAIHRPVLELREGAHADHVHVAAEHARHLGDVLLGLAVHHRTDLEFDRPGILARRQHDGLAAELVRAQLETGAGTHGRVEKQQCDGLAGQLLADLRLLELHGLRQQRVKVAAAPVLGVEKVAKAHGTSGSEGKLWVLLEHKQENPARGRVFVIGHARHATAYPAGNEYSGRRAREVMPAAMRALVRIAGAADTGITGCNSGRASTYKYTKRQGGASAGAGFAYDFAPWQWQRVG